MQIVKADEKGKTVKISTNTFKLDEAFTFTPVETKWEGINNFKEETVLWRIKVNGEYISTFQRKGGAFEKVCSANKGKEITIKKVTKESNKGQPYYTFEVVSGGSNSTPIAPELYNDKFVNAVITPKVQLQSLNYSEGNTKFHEKDLVELLKKYNKFDDEEEWISSFVKYGTSPLRAKMLYDNRNNLEG